jgi:hypothetical protein
MDIKENTQQEEKNITFDDMVNYMISLGELLTILEDSNAPQKYALQIKICDEIDGILDLLSFNGKA